MAGCGLSIGWVNLWTLACPSIAYLCPFMWAVKQAIIRNPVLYRMFENVYENKQLLMGLD